MWRCDQFNGLRFGAHGNSRNVGKTVAAATPLNNRDSRWLSVLSGCQRHGNNQGASEGGAVVIATVDVGTDAGSITRAGTDCGRPAMAAPAPALSKTTAT